MPTTTPRGSSLAAARATRRGRPLTAQTVNKLHRLQAQPGHPIQWGTFKGLNNLYRLQEQSQKRGWSIHWEYEPIGDGMVRVWATWDGPPVTVEDRPTSSVRSETSTPNETPAQGENIVVLRQILEALHTLPERIRESASEEATAV